MHTTIVVHPAARSFRWVFAAVQLSLSSLICCSSVMHVNRRRLSPTSMHLRPATAIEERRHRGFCCRHLWSLKTLFFG
ncbi:unnamed protein product, partial [Citrullus colocynthis]